MAIRSPIVAQSTPSIRILRDSGIDSLFAHFRHTSLFVAPSCYQTPRDSFFREKLKNKPEDSQRCCKAFPFASLDFLTRTRTSARRESKYKARSPLVSLSRVQTWHTFFVYPSMSDHERDAFSSRTSRFTFFCAFGGGFEEGFFLTTAIRTHKHAHQHTQEQKNSPIPVRSSHHNHRLE